MVQQSSEEQPVSDDPFQSPEMLDMQRKMRKMVLVSVVVMFMGVLSIIGVLIYKSVSGKERAPVAKAPDAPVTHMLKAGETVRSMIVEGGDVYLLVDGQGMTSVLKIGKKDGQVERRIEFIPQGG